jgi:Zinc-binding dehydrogenase
VAEGRVRIDVNTVPPLSGAIEAHRRVESAATTGKAVLEVHPPD